MYLRFNVVIEQCPKYALLRCEIFGLKFRRCKTLDKYHVYTHIAIVEWIIKSFLFSKILRESLKKFAQFMPLFPKLEVDSMQKKRYWTNTLAFMTVSELLKPGHFHWGHNWDFSWPSENPAQAWNLDAKRDKHPFM